MGIETATYISQLVASNPVGNVDDYATADDHLRLIKAVLQSQFPNFTAAAVNLTPAELNLLDGLTAEASEINTLDGYTGNTADLNILSGANAGGLTAAELLYVAGVTSDIQTQLDGKTATGHAHSTADITSGTLADALVAASNVTQHVGVIDHDSLLNYAGAEHVDWALTGAEDIHVDRLVAADIEGLVSHDNLQGIPANDHIDHSTVDVIAGSFLTGGGDLTADRTLNLSFSGEALLSSEIITGDEFLYSDGGTLKRAPYRDITIPVTTQGGASYTGVLADGNSLIRMNSGSPQTFTIPANASVAYKIGTVITLFQQGAGQTTVAINTDTLRIPNGDSINQQYGLANAIKVNTTEWVLTGDVI